MVKLILSLDGGGVRGSVTAHFLAKLEEALGSPLSEVFDLFVGTSTGSIIAAALAAKKAPAIDTTRMYESANVTKIFDKSITDKILGVAQSEPKYNGKGKKAFLDNFFGSMTFDQAGTKKLAITAYDIERRCVYVISNRKPKCCTTSVADACNASSAAPAYFPSVLVDGRWLIDGGIVANNPTMVAYAEAKNLWPDEELFIVSVGTGSRTVPLAGKKAAGWGGIQWLSNGLLDLAMDETVVEWQAKYILKNNYIRVNGPLGDVSEDMDETGQTNLNNLKCLGEQWFNTEGHKVLDIISAARANK